MMHTDQFERAALAAVQKVVAAALPSLAERGVNISGLDISRTGVGNEYESELRLYAYRDGQLCDALEVHAWRDGRPSATVEELCDWFQAQLIDLG
jgi:hypothetical protein